MKSIFLILMTSILLVDGVSPHPAGACTRVLWRTTEAISVPGQPLPASTPVIVGRTEDWLWKLQNRFRAFPSGVLRSGLAAVNPMTWRSAYGSLVLTFLDVGILEGMNEKGLSARLLHLADTDYGIRDVARPGIVASIWPQYILDNFTTVEEAVRAMNELHIQVLPLGMPPGTSAPYHLAIEDSTGDSAIIEFIKGQMQVYHDRRYTVMTNAPTYDRQLENLGNSARESLPGGLESRERFVRAYYHLNRLYRPENEEVAASYMFGLLCTVSVPFGRLPDAWPTWWRSVMDLTNRVYYFSSTLKPSVVWATMSMLDLSAGGPEKGYDVEDGPALNGDISLRLQAAEPFQFKASIDYVPAAPN